MGLLVAVVALFGAGVAGSLSPCVLPLVPGYLGVLADGQTGTGGRRVARVITFCVAAVATFVALGSIVAAVGASVSFSAAAAQRIAGALLIGFALLAACAANGWWAPSWRPIRWMPLHAGWRAAVLGVACGAAWSPCVGPLLGAALTAAGGSGSVARGALLLAGFGCGVVSPFIALSLLPSPRAGARWRGLGRLSGRVTPWLLAALGLLLLSGAYGAVVQRLVIAT